MNETRRLQATDYVGFALIAWSMAAWVAALVRNPDNKVAWTLAVPMFVVGALLARRRWRHIKNGVPRV